MRAVLPTAQNKIYFPARRINAPKYLRRLRREPNFPSSKIQSMRALQRAQINRRQRLLIHQINHRQRVQRPRPSAAIIRNVGKLPIRGRNHLVRVRTHRHLRHHLQCRRIDNRQRLIML